MNKAARQQRFDELQIEMRACRLCRAAGYYIEPPAVTKGNLGARIVTIGQAPGVTEVVAKRPFNAGSGKRLFQWLGEVFVKRVRGKVIVANPECAGSDQGNFLI